MTTDELIKLAREAGMGGMLTDGVCTLDELARFATLVRAEVLEVLREIVEWHGNEISDPDLLEAARAAIAKAMGEVKTCKPHPDAPHGFDCDGSHSEGRYVCTCEYWEPPQQEELRRLHAENGTLRNSRATDEALLREALYALEYAADMTKPADLQGCTCPVCTNIAALRERLARYQPTENEGSEP